MVSEVGLFKVSDFKRKERIQESSDAFQTLEESEKVFAKKFFHGKVA